MRVNSITALIPYSPDRISMRALSDKIGCTERETRKYIHNARLAGEVIGADKRGYFIPVSNKELITHYKFARSRVLSTLKSLKAERQMLRAAGVDISKIEGRKHGRAKNVCQKYY